MPAPRSAAMPPYGMVKAGPRPESGALLQWDFPLAVTGDENVVLGLTSETGQIATFTGYPELPSLNGVIIPNALYLIRNGGGVEASQHYLSGVGIR